MSNISILAQVASIKEQSLQSQLVIAAIKQEADLQKQVAQNLSKEAEKVKEINEFSFSTHA